MKYSFSLIVIGTILGILFFFKGYSIFNLIFAAVLMLSLIIVAYMMLNHKKISADKIDLYVMGFITTILLIPFQGLEIFNFHIRLVDIAVLTTLLYFFFTYSIDRKYMLKTNIIFPLLGLIVYGALILSFQSFSISNSLIEIIELIEITLFFIILYFLAEKLKNRDFEKIAHLIFIISVIGAFIRIIFYVMTADRFVGVWFLAGIMTYGFYYSGLMYLREQRLIYLLSLILFIITIFLSRTRGTLAVIIIVPLIYYLLKFKELSRRYKLKNIIKLFGIFFIIAILIVLSIPKVSQRLYSITDQSQGFYSRPIIWIGGLYVFEKYPYGVGLKNFKEALSQEAAELIYPVWFVDIVGEEAINKQVSIFESRGRGAHNDWFRILIELGLVGLALFALFWLFPIKDMLDLNPGNPIIILFSMMVIEGFINSLKGNIFLTENFYLSILFIVILRRIKNDKNE